MNEKKVYRRLTGTFGVGDIVETFHGNNNIDCTTPVRGEIIDKLPNEEFELEVINKGSHTCDYRSWKTRILRYANEVKHV